MSTAAFEEEEVVITQREPRRPAAGKLLAGKRALVTGGSRGIGKAVAPGAGRSRRRGCRQLPALG